MFTYSGQGHENMSLLQYLLSFRLKIFLRKLHILLIEVRCSSFFDELIASEKQSQFKNCRLLFPCQEGCVKNVICIHVSLQVHLYYTKTHMPLSNTCLAIKKVNCATEQIFPILVFCCSLWLNRNWYLKFRFILKDLNNYFGQFLSAQEDLKRFPLLLWWYASWCCNKVTFVQVHWTVLCKCSLLQDKAMKACLCSNSCFLFVWKFSSENSTSYWSRCRGALFFVLWSNDGKWKTPSVCVVFPC